MKEPDGETVDFGAQPSDAAAESSGHALHRPGYMEAPAQVADAAAEEVEGAVRPQILRISEE